MELDELKTAWRTLDRRLEQHNALSLQLLVDSRLNALRTRLRPLYRGQALQILFGVLLVVAAAIFWTRHRDAMHLLLAGVCLHLYGVLTIVFAAVTLALMERIDYAAPVLTIQKQLAALRRFYIRNALVAGLSWWLLWVPLLMMFLMGVYGVDVYAHAPSVIYSGLAVGVAGLLASYGLHRWSRDGRRPLLAKFLNDSMTGSSLRKAQALLDEIARFERD
ncbi:MAG TPA: serine/threonine protein kinase [Dokdonella sp.]